mmetsp:Transcript_93745/g.264679  ORF Transcript_93745/g.264679 Transcript_93745/m.264679 type:complete len:789 (+) Transcript_93745:36-2402(+)
MAAQRLAHPQTGRSSEFRQLRIQLYREGSHAFVPVIVTLALLLATGVTFPDRETRNLAIGHLLAWAVSLCCAYRHAFWSAWAESPTVGPLLGCERSEFLPAPGPTALVVSIDDAMGLVATGFVVWSVLGALTAVQDDANARSAKFWWAVVSYAVYLVQALGGDFFLCLVRSAAAEWRAAADAVAGGLGGQSEHGMGRDLCEAVASLRDAQPRVYLRAASGHRAGKKYVATHHAKEWVPFDVWRDATELPPESGRSENLGIVMVRVLVRLEPCEAFESLRARFEVNHRHDVLTQITAGLLVARLEDGASWAGLWRAPRFVYGRLGRPGGLALTYAFAACTLVAVPARLVIKSRAAQLVVVVRKEVGLHAVDVGGSDDSMSFSDRWRRCGPVPPPSGKLGRFGWTFGTSAMERAQEVSESNVESDVAASGRALPDVTLIDFLARWLRPRPYVRAAIAMGLILADAILAMFSARSRSLALLALVLLGPLCCMQVLHTVAHARDRLRWRDSSSAAFAAAVAVGTLLSMAVLMCCSLWMMVAWEIGFGSSAYDFASVSDLYRANAKAAWAVHLSDGFVDTSREVSEHRLCKTRDGRGFSCGFMYAAPIFGNATAARSGIHAPAWVVDFEPIDGQTPRKPPTHGFCGIAAERLLWPTAFRRFRAMVEQAEREWLGSVRLGETRDGDSPLLFLARDPTVYFRWQPRVAWIGLSGVLLLSPIGFAAIQWVLGAKFRGASDDGRLFVAAGSSHRDAVFASEALLDEAMDAAPDSNIDEHVPLAGTAPAGDAFADAAE